MTEKKPDVEAILKELQTTLQKADATAPSLNEAVGDDDLYAALQAANEICATLSAAPGFKDRLLGKMMGPRWKAAQEAPIHLTRVLNALVAVLDARDEALRPELLQKAVRRRDMLLALEERVADLEKDQV